MLSEEPVTAEGSVLPENDGYCVCCRAASVFREDRPWLRDHYVCTRCGSTPRLRHVLLVLDSRFPEWEDLTIHESSPAAPFIERHARRYTASQYLPEVPSGTVQDGVLCEDVEALSMADNSIDLFITQDVLEHVFDPGRAIREIQRVLRPGGAHVFTTPKHADLRYTRQRASKMADGTVQHLLEPEYHGSPVGNSRVLVTYDFGYDLEARLSVWSGSDVNTIQRIDRTLGLEAEFNEVFIIYKPSTFPHSSPAAHAAAWAATVAARDGVISRQDCEIAALRKSTSWRVTAPLRLAADRARAIRSRRTS